MNKMIITSAIIIILILIAIGWWWFSHQNQPPSCQLQKVETIVGSVTTTKTHTYDAQERVSSVQSSDGKNKTYTYTPFISPTTVVLDQTNPSKTITYSLNSQGLAVNDDRGISYSYDSAGYLIKEQHQDYSDDRVIVGGNVTTESRTYPNNPANDITFSTTYSTLLYCLDDGVDFLGKKNTNWPSLMTQSDGSPSIQYTYQTDSQGRVIKQTATGGQNLVTTYTY